MADAEPGSESGSSQVARRLATPAVALLLALLSPVSAAMAATSETTTGESTSGYHQSPMPPSYEQTTSPPPKSNTGHELGKGPPPTRETLPKSGVKPEIERAPVADVRAAPAARALPLTGFDLRWELGLGALALGAGVTIMAAQSRRRAGRAKR
jgi:hypothetical protein